MTNPKVDGLQAKHRACDECRSRKLACTKEADGCARCKREGIACHYSPQKPMGRPRKRPTAVETARGEGQEPVIVPADETAMDVDAAFLDSNGNDFSFLDLLGPEYLSGQPQGPQSQRLEPVPDESFKGPWHFDIANINFGAGGGAGDSAQEPASQEPGQRDFLPSSAQIPGLSSQGSTPPDSGLPENSVGDSCTCLAGLYLALDSLQRLPNRVGPAMKVARGACKAAHDAIQCPTCSPPFVHATENLPMASFRNMMLIGALLPSVADAYQRILKMVDEEVDKATAERRQLPFQLNDYGGLWGPLASSSCDVDSHFRQKPLEPAMWRLTIRAILKIDIYGISSNADESNTGCMTFTQLGLKDVIVKMDEMSRSRHEQMDAMVAAGFTVNGPGGCPHPPLQPGEKPTCQKIIDIARIAMSQLVIA
ncbi:Lactose regulatory protein LAC9-like protein 2 [Pleurostoma richardsiae]|uniref:Lactose regulatory protein LAC9-like protein 2 n=1 Tax=Pleurostoma richardsiae TaxID=41990 RepID=A0AA38S7I2_9PEZI|nr:Lactose regulatory protein LAC9-like protein 2 [Pleurostoma richardsiae]